MEQLLPSIKSNVSTRNVMKIKLLSSLLLASTFAYAAVPINGLYGEVFGGYTYMPTNVFTAYNGTTFTNAHYNSGYHGGGRFGYKDNPMRYELEVSYLSAIPSQLNVDAVDLRGLSGQTSAAVGLINAYFDFPEIIPTLNPYISGGIGYAYVSSRISTTISSPSFLFRATDSAFAYQGSVGIAYNFAYNYSLDVAYRYLGTSHINEMGENFQAHMASAGVTYRFDGGEYK
jgi:opacity protein-like surface antigen